MLPVDSWYMRRRAWSSRGRHPRRDRRASGPKDTARCAGAVARGARAVGRLLRRSPEASIYAAGGGLNPRRLRRIFKTIHVLVQRDRVGFLPRAELRLLAPQPALRLGDLHPLTGARADQ